MKNEQKQNELKQMREQQLANNEQQKTTSFLAEGRLQ